MSAADKERARASLAAHILASQNAGGASETEAAFARLEHLYEVSKCLTNFDDVEESFPKILTLVSAVFPLVSAVLIDNRGPSPRTVLWPTVGLTPKQVSRTISHAKAAYSYMMGSTIEETQILKTEATVSASLHGGKFTDQTNDHTNDSFLPFPLVVDRGAVFGIVQFEGLTPIYEDDVKFTNAVANLIAVALDRYHRVYQERLTAKNKTDLVRGERDDSRKFAIELEEERSVREQFVQTLSHDLRTPLATISASAQMLAESERLDTEEKQLVQTLLASTRRLGHMIDSLLDANRLRAGERIPLYLDECDYRTIITDAVREMIALSSGGIELDCTKPVDGFWDGDALRRMTENLIGNAIKYGDAGRPVRVSLSASSLAATLQVHNEGNPISKENQEKLFTHFHRSDSAQAGKKAGWGIGLTLVKGISECHGGRVWVESSPEKGTSFYVEIPLDSRPFEVLS